MRKYGKIVLIIVLAFTLVFSLFACKTGAYWQGQGDDTRGKDADIPTVNGSEKYIVFAALDSSGNLIASGSSTETAAYAVVGYTGLVAELTIPAQYDNKNVTKVLVAAPYSAYKCYMNGAAYTGDDARLANQTVVTSIVFGSNVAMVGAGVCAGMVNLASIKFGSASAVELGDKAFSACTALTTVTGSWAPATGATPFFASGYTPAP